MQFYEKTTMGRVPRVTCVAAPSSAEESWNWTMLFCGYQNSIGKAERLQEWANANMRLNECWTTDWCILGTLVDYVHSWDCCYSDGVFSWQSLTLSFLFSLWSTRYAWKTQNKDGMNALIFKLTNQASSRATGNLHHVSFPSLARKELCSTCRRETLKVAQLSALVLYTC